MIRIFLVRHAVTQWNEDKRYLGVTDLSLSKKGKQQAESVANSLKDEYIDEIYSSNLKRTVETANYIRKDRETQFILDNRLRELNLGVFEGLTFAEAQEQHPELMAAWLDDYDLPPTGGEMFSSLTARIRSFLDEIMMRETPNTILVVTHGGPLREIFRLLLELPAEKHWALQFDPASWSEIHMIEGSLTIIGTNHTHHLRGVSP